MKRITIQPRAFLFLQGPPGNFFFRLGQELRRTGAAIHRINLNGGDRYNWRDGAVDFRGRMSAWPLFFDRYVRTNGITDVILYGDCRPMHKAAIHLAQLRGVRVHVFEEGYIRPDWMTLEREGVNGHSTLPRDPAAIVAMARNMPPVPDLPAITASFGRRAHDSYWYYHHVLTGLFRFPFYRSHRQAAILHEGFGWLYKFARAKRRAKEADKVLARIDGRKFFLFPLQLSGDYQIRAHSPFGSMYDACEYVLDSFAQFAPPDTILVVKEHPLDCRFSDWPSYLRRLALHLGIADRVFHIDGGDLQKMAISALGVVCVNSTSGTLALEQGRPVIVLGDAVYDVPGITHQGALDQFWVRPMAPEPGLYQAFKRVLHARCLVRGGLASESAISILVENSVARLLAEDSIEIGADAFGVMQSGARHQA